jgi:uncharacterized protein (TIGR03000 family)
MFQKMLSFGGTLALLGAAFLWSAGLADARGGGGGGHGGGGGGHGGGGGGHGGGGGGHGGGGGGHGGGGFHGGGFGGGHYGGYHGGSHYGGGWGGYHGGYGGYHNGYGHYGYHHDGYGHYHHFYPYGFGYGYYPYYNYGYYPYYDNYSYDYPYLGSALGYDSGYSDGTAIPSTTYVAPASAAPADRPIHLTVNVPADAQVWVDNTKTTSTGPVRQFESPPVTPGERYTYKIQARWNENGHELTQTQEVKVTAGARVNVNFPVPSATAEPKAAGG